MLSQSSTQALPVWTISCSPTSGLLSRLFSRSPPSAGAPLPEPTEPSREDLLTEFLRLNYSFSSAEAAKWLKICSRVVWETEYSLSMYWSLWSSTRPNMEPMVVWLSLFNFSFHELLQCSTTSASGNLDVNMSMNCCPWYSANCH